MNKPKTKKTKSIHARLIRHLRQWHRRLGIIAAFFLIFLSVTGVALNHTTLFSLAHQPISNTWLLSHYGVKPPQDIRYYQNKKWLVTDNLVWLNDKLLFEKDENDNAIIGIAKLAPYNVVVTSRQLILFTETGELVDKIDGSTGLPTPITAVTVTDDNVIVNTNNGYYQSDSDFFDWQNIQIVTPPTWVSVEQANNTEIQTAKKQYQAQFLNWERVILDAHSGRLFGDLGVLFMDIVALILILLSVSGIYIWLRYRQNKR